MLTFADAATGGSSAQKATDRRLFHGSIDEVRSWADQQILASDEPPPEWLIGLSLSTTLREAAEALGRELARRAVLPDEISGLLVGLTYLRYRRGELSKEELVAKVGGILDAYNSFEIDVETWYACTTDGAEIPTSIGKLLDEAAANAEAELSRLLGTRNAAAQEFWAEASTAAAGG